MTRQARSGVLNKAADAVRVSQVRPVIRVTRCALHPGYFVSVPRPL